MSRVRTNIEIEDTYLHAVMDRYGLHTKTEAVEFALARIRCRYFATDDVGEDMHGYWFFAAHNDFSDACGRAAKFLTPALPKMAEEWKKWKKVKK